MHVDVDKVSDAGERFMGMDTANLATMIGSRICHDLISPVGAINNGLEVLNEEKDEGMREFAMDLIHKSSAQASAKLQFARLV